MTETFRNRQIFVWLLVAIGLLAVNNNAVFGQTETDPRVELESRYTLLSLQVDLVWQDLSQLEEAADLSELKIFAEDAAKSEDYELALIYIEEILRVAREHGMIPNKESKSEINATASFSSAKSDNFTKRWLLGYEFSRQEYNLTFGSSDSALIESINNPFAGLQLRWLKDHSEHWKTELGGTVKFSRDYSFWEGMSSLEYARLNDFAFQLEEAVEGTNYREYLPIQYWQSVSRVGVEKKFGEKVSFSVEDEFQARRYHQNTETFDSYWQNSGRFSAKFSPASNHQIYFSLDKERRRQTTYSEYDYDDLRLNVQQMLIPSWRTLISAWYQFKQIDYATEFVDSVYVSDYSQHYLSFTFKQNVQDRVALRLFGEAYSRNYPEQALLFPDYYFLRTEPGLRLELSEKFTFGVDYLLEIKKYKKSDTPTDRLIWSEDFIGEGVILSCNFFNYSNLMFSLQHTFRLNSYPNAPEALYPGFSLYTDRRVNTTLLFLSYQLFPGLEINLILQNDLDDDQEIQNNHSRSAIFTLDVGWNW